MPEITVEVGGRPYRVACEPGEESLLGEAARQLDTEARTLTQALGTGLPESRMLLMAGLMLADRLNGVETKKRAADEALLAAEQRAREAEKAARTGAEAPRPVPAQPALFTDPDGERAMALLEDMAGRLEDIADRLEADAP